MTFLPQGYELPKSAESRYFKLEQGDNKFRILGQAITGYEYFTNEKKPVRSAESFKETPNIGTNDDGTPKKVQHFWAFPVWSYKSGQVEVFEVTQKTIQAALAGYSADEDWGDVTSYDITINKKGEKLTTEYNVRPSPKKPLAEEVVAVVNATAKPKLEALFTNGNPFESTEKFETLESVVAEIEQAF